MERCKSVGTFRVTLDCVELEPQAVQIQGHASRPWTEFEEDGKTPRRLIEAGPVVSTVEPLEGELCEHELQWLRSMPGKAFSALYRFKVEAL